MSPRLATQSFKHNNSMGTADRIYTLHVTKTHHVLFGSKTSAIVFVMMSLWAVTMVTIQVSPWERGTVTHLVFPFSFGLLRGDAACLVSISSIDEEPSMLFCSLTAALLVGREENMVGWRGERRVEKKGMVGRGGWRRRGRMGAGGEREREGERRGRAREGERGGGQGEGAGESRKESDTAVSKQTLEVGLTKDSIS